MSVTYPFRRVLVPTDFSSCSESALDLAARIVREHGAELTAMHVVELGALAPDTVIHPPELGRGVTVGEHLRSLATSALETALASLPLTRAIMRHEVQFGRPAAVIVEAMERLAPDLVVMGTHGRGGIAHLLMGSVAERVLRHARVPVLTVRESVCVARPLDTGLVGEADG